LSDAGHQIASTEARLSTQEAVSLHLRNKGIIIGMLHHQKNQGTDEATGNTTRIRIAFWAILVLGVIARLLLYGDPRLAIATLDTKSYIDSSRASLLSWDAFRGRRLFTTNMVYKLISSNSNCGQIPISMVSVPAVGAKAGHEIHPCFETITVLQTFLSIASWLWLIFVVSRHLKAPLAKLLAAWVLVLFAFTPQIAEWDSILTSESLSLSLFVLSLGFLIEITFCLADESIKKDGTVNSLYILWFIFFALWLFVRDTNLIAIPVTLMFLVPIFLSKRFRTKPFILAPAILLIVLFAIGLLSSRQSPRWPPSIQETLQDWIFPFPARVQFLTEHFSMPAPDSANYQSWFNSRAPTAYSMFLLSHPGFIVTTLKDNWLVLHLSYMQPYYKLTKTNIDLVLLQVGEIVHPGSVAFYFADTIVMVLLWALVLSGRWRDRLAWMWALTWLYLTAGITLSLSFFGDSEGVMRHIFPSLVMFRLFLWVSLIVVIDAFIDRSDHPLSARSTSALQEMPKS
jgi:hypothetical protein